MSRRSLGAAARLWPLNTGAAVVRSSQRLGDDTVAKANPEGLATAWWRMRLREDAPVADANSRDRRCRCRLVCRSARPRKVETQLGDEVAHAQREPLVCITGPRDVE